MANRAEDEPPDYRFWPQGLHMIPERPANYDPSHSWAQPQYYASLSPTAYQHYQVPTRPYYPSVAQSSDQYRPVEQSQSTGQYSPTQTFGQYYQPSQPSGLQQHESVNNRIRRLSLREQHGYVQADPVSHRPHSEPLPGDSTQVVAQDTSPGRKLNEAYQKRKYPKRFFVVGRVFQAVHNETSEIRSGQSGVVSNAWSRDSFGQWVHSSFRRFVVVREGNWSCTTLPITTYGGDGMAKPGVRINEHGLIYTGKIEPAITDVPAGGPQMQTYAIRVDPDKLTERLDEMSRIDYAKTHNIDHKIRVKPIGKVNHESMVHLLIQYQNVTFGNDERSARRDSRLGRLPSPPSSDAPTPLVVGDRPYHSLAIQAVRDLVAAGWKYETAVAMLKAAPQDLAEDFEALAIGTDEEDHDGVVDPGRRSSEEG